MRPFAAALLTALLLSTACQPSEDPSPSARAVLDSAIAEHGGSVLDQAVVSFDFRGEKYTLRQEGGRFHYRRAYTDSVGRSLVEGITNDTTYRVVNGDTTALSSAEKSAVKTTVNSVSYFALLPHPLSDSAVVPHYSGRDTIDGQPYHRIRVTFQQEGGGKDWQDIFMYWFRTDTYSMDYLAYAFGLAPGDMDTGTRFREAYNVRRPNGVRMADYMNYTADTLAPDRLHRYPDLLKQDAIELVSRVELDSIQVRPLSPEK